MWPERPSAESPTPTDPQPDPRRDPVHGGPAPTWSGQPPMTYPPDPGSPAPPPPAPGAFPGAAVPPAWRVAEPRRPRVGLSIALIAVLLVAFFAGIAVDRTVVATSPASPTPGVANGGSSEPPQFKALWEAWDVLHQHYVDPSALDPSTLANGAIRGLVDAVGDTGHTRFLTAAEVTASHQSLSGSITGIGARMSQVDTSFVVQSVVPGSPAEKAGLRAGDSVLEVNGVSVEGKTLDDVVSSIRGDAGTSVRLQIGRPSQAGFEVTIVRATISVPAVSWSLVPGTKIADIRIEEFSKGVTDDLKGALLDAGKAGATGVILDLRDDPGGYVDEAVGVASVFLSSGTVYQERDGSGKTTLVPVKAGERATDLPLAMLVNLGSASASEIVAGAIQDAGRAKVYGATTFGTGTVLSEFDLSDGSALLVGTLEWLTPDGRQIWHHGITPNVSVDMPTGARVVTPDQLKSGGAGALSTANDAQLKAAAAALGGS